MLQEIAVRSGLPVSVLSLEETAGVYSRASKSAATRRGLIRLTPQTSPPGANVTHLNRFQRA